MILGIDFGSTGTKLTLYNDGEFKAFLRVNSVKSSDELKNVINLLLKKTNSSPQDIKKIAETGISSGKFSYTDCDAETVRISEFISVAEGGLYDSGLLKAFVVSMGTGTAFVRAGKENDVLNAQHIGGTGIGGGFVMGLGEIITGENDIDEIVKISEKGDYRKVDLLIGNLTTKDVSTLKGDTTAANFGYLKEGYTKSDIISGIFNAVYQTIGMLCVFAARNDEIKDFIITGAVAELQIAREVFAIFTKSYGVNIIIPKNAEFRTVMGAVLISEKNK